MHRLRACLVRHPRAAALVVAAALLLRVLVPAGFMPVVEHGRIGLAICSGTGPLTLEAKAAVTRIAAMAAMMDHAGGAPHHDMPGKADSPCAFADLSLSLVGGADPVLLAAALAFVMALAFAAVPWRLPRAAPRLRPPSHAPPFPA